MFSIPFKGLADIGEISPLGICIGGIFSFPMVIAYRGGRGDPCLKIFSLRRNYVHCNKS